MESFVKSFSLTLLIFTIFSRSHGATHWVVTEDGHIKAETDSIFNMRRPYDFMSLLKQAERADKLKKLRDELIERKAEIDQNEDKDTGLEQRFYSTDSDCVTAGKPLPEFDLYISTVLPLENKGIRPELHIDFNAPPSTMPLPPDCTTVGVALDFSMYAFEHLSGLQNRANLSGSPELGLKNAIAHRDNVDDYGNLVLEALVQNNTSWVLYNMAAFYWRIKGSPYHVVECVRRALHFSPWEHRDVALISLANVLHRAHYSHEAAIVVHAALDVSRELNVNHFTLGNIYAVLRDYNNSVLCYENTLSLQPDFEAADKRRHAVLCHAKLEAALEKQHKSLQRTLDDLKDYQAKYAQLQAQQERLQSEQASPDTKLQQQLAYETFMNREREIAMGYGTFDVKSREREIAMDYGEVCEKDVDGEMQCSWGLRRSIITDDDFRPYSDIVARAEPSDVTDYSVPKRPPRYTVKHPPLPQGIKHMAFQVPDWPEKEECDLFVVKFPAWNEFPTTYLSPENKGYDVRPLLNEAQGLSVGEEHPLPWYPPVCMTLTDIPESSRSFDHVQAVKDRTQIPLKLYDTNMKQVLLDHVEGPDMTEEEVGQRIMTALKLKIGPSWALYNLAGLYWRIIGNSYHGVECIRRALYFAPDEYRDVPLVNLANILYKWGRVDEAITVAREALLINDLEPDTHYLLGNLLAANGNLEGSIHHYEEALYQEPLHRHAMDSLRTVKCYQKFHRSAQSTATNGKTALSAGAGERCNDNKVLLPNPCGAGNGVFGAGGNGGGGGARDQKVMCKNDCVAFDPTSEMNNRCTSFSISAQRMHIHCTGGRGLPQQ